MAIRVIIAGGKKTERSDNMDRFDTTDTQGRGSSEKCNS